MKKNGHLARFIKLSKKMGNNGTRQFVELWYTAKAGTTPLRVKLLITGAIGYVLLPADVIPDFIPAVGYSDDLTALGACFAAASGHITDDIRKKAESRIEQIHKKVRQWFEQH